MTDNIHNLFKKCCLQGKSQSIMMKFSLRMSVLMALGVGLVLLYMSQWFTKNSIGSWIWSSSHDAHQHPNEPRDVSLNQMPALPGGNDNKDNTLYFKKKQPQTIQQCELGAQSSKPRALADIKSWEILEKLTPESTGRMVRNGVFVNDNRQNNEPDPAAEAKRSKRPLKVIVVPHSHCDPGWHKTVDGYFDDQTHPTLDNMVEKLMKFPKMTFIWAESVFLSLWWKGIDDNKKNDVKRLIKEGRLEIVVGSWVVPDEANPHYFALIDQMIEGHQWLWDNIGVKPNNTWALDPFGYSSGLPYLYKLAGFENMVILRVHEHVKNELIKQQALEFKWRQSWDQNGENDIRTQMMPYKLYNIKHTCGPDHQVCLLFDFRNIPGEISESRAEPITQFNVDRLSKILLGQYHKKARLFRHNVLLVPLGDDFRYDRNIEWDQQYKNYMMLFNHMNGQPSWNVQARFGTLQDYFNELDVEMKLDPSLKLPTLEGDFFPYTDEHDDFWTGYFTSRPYDKNLGREVESHIRMADIFNAVATAGGVSQGRRYMYSDSNLRLLENAHQALGLFQHHDAITGTARSYVVIDYENRLNTALMDTQSVIMNAVKHLLSDTMDTKKFVIDIDDAYSMRSVMKSRKVIRVSPLGTDVVFANSLSNTRHELVHLLVSADTVEVISHEGDIIPSQMAPVWRTMELVNDQFELVFYVTLPPMSVTTYKVRAASRDKGRKNSASLVRLYNTQDYRVPHNIRFQVLPPGGQSILLENDEYRLRFSTRTGLMHTLTTKKTIQTTKLNMQYLMYKSRGSGAYIFNPAGPAIDNELSSRPSVRVITGPLMSEIHIIHTSLTSKVRIYNTTRPLGLAIAVENVVDMRDLNDKELVMRLSTDILTNGTFYTDMNGLEIIRRKRNPRFGVQANYYPMTSMAYIEDTRSRLTVVTGQPLGVTSPSDGSFEVMLDRRLSYDDGRGLGEGVLDNKVTPSRFFIMLEHPTVAARSQQSASAPKPSDPLPRPSLTSVLLGERLNYPIFTLFAASNNSEASVRQYKAFKEPLQCDVRVVDMRTLRGVASKEPERVALVLHRQAYDCAFSQADLSTCPAEGSIRLDNLFAHAPITRAKQTSLSLMHDKRTQKVDQSVALNPMELATYVVEFR